SATLAGMNRVRSLALNDAHIFCTPEPQLDEVKGAIDLALYFSKVLGIDEFWYQLSTRDDVKDTWLGTEEQWQQPQAALAGARHGCEWKSTTGRKRCSARFVTPRTGRCLTWRSSVRAKPRRSM